MKIVQVACNGYISTYAQRSLPLQHRCLSQMPFKSLLALPERCMVHMLSQLKTFHLTHSCCEEIVSRDVHFESLSAATQFLNSSDAA